MKGLGAPGSARIFVAGGEPFGGDLALQPLTAEFRNMVRKEMLAKEGELSHYVNRSSALAAIDYIVSLSSDVFIASHGGNMARAMQVSFKYRLLINLQELSTSTTRLFPLLYSTLCHLMRHCHTTFMEL